MSIQDIESTEFEVQFRDNQKIETNNQASQVDLLGGPDPKQFHSKGVFVRPSDFNVSIAQSESYNSRLNYVDEYQNQAMPTSGTMERKNSIHQNSRSIKTDKRASEIQEVDKLINSTFLTNKTCKVVDELSRSNLEN